MAPDRQELAELLLAMLSSLSNGYLPLQGFELIDRDCFQVRLWLPLFGHLQGRIDWAWRTIEPRTLPEDVRSDYFRRQRRSA